MTLKSDVGEMSQSPPPTTQPRSPLRAMSERGRKKRPLREASPRGRFRCNTSVEEWPRDVAPNQACSHRETKSPTVPSKANTPARRSAQLGADFVLPPRWPARSLSAQECKRRETIRTLASRRAKAARRERGCTRSQAPPEQAQAGGKAAPCQRLPRQRLPAWRAMLPTFRARVRERSRARRALALRSSKSS